MKRMFTSVLLFCSFSLAAQTTVVRKLDGTTITPAQIDETVNRLMKAGKVDGLCLSILNDNKVAYQNAYGYKSAGEGKLMDTATVIYAASFSKAVFAFISLHLVQQGILDLDKPLVDYLGGSLKDMDHAEQIALDERSKLITARMCLSHTTGLQNIWWMNPYNGNVDTTATLKIFFTPGTQYAYSGEGLKILQKVEEKLTGKSLQQLADELVFVPAGMTRSSYIWKKEFEENSAWGHDEKGKAGTKQRSTKAGAAGSMNTTIADYGRFISYVMQGKGLRPEYLAMMETPQIRIHSKYQFPTLGVESTQQNDGIGLSYGLGWGLIRTKYGPAFFKEGHHDFWRNYNINFPDKKISIIIMTNSANGEGIFKELLEKLIGDTFTPWEWEGYVPYDMVTK